MINQSRRNLLKGIAYGSALSVGGLSTAAMALSGTNKTKKTSGTALPTCDITIFQQQTSGKEIVSLMNLTDKTITLDSIRPVNLEHVNGSLSVKVNNLPGGTLSIAAGERLSFDVEATSTIQTDENSLQIPNVLAGHLRIKSNHPAFNGIIPVTVFDAQTV